MKTILIADEDADIRESISLMFSGCAGYRVVTAPSGVDAISKARKIKPDIVLADVSLSDRDGYEVSREIKDNPLLQNTSVILLISSLEAFDEGKAADVLADDFVIKPFNSDEITRKAECLIRQREGNIGSETFSEKITGKENADLLKTIRLSIKSRENCCELTEESAQQLKMAIRMTTSKLKDREDIPTQMPAKAEYLQVLRYLSKKRYSVAPLGLGVILLIVLLAFVGGEKKDKAVSWLSNISASADSSTQSGLNPDSSVPLSDDKGLEETPKGLKEATPVRENAESQGVKGETSSLKGRTRKITKHRAKKLRARSQFVLASNNGKKELLERQLRMAFLLYNP